MIHTDIALRRPITTVMVFLPLTLIGLIATKLLPLEQFPDITFPGMQVTIPYAGSTPEEIEELITRPVEEALSTLSGIKELQSTSRENEAEFQIQFDWGTDIEAVSFEVRTKLDSVRGQLPAGADRMLIFAGSFGDQPVVKIRLAANQDLSDAYDVLERHLKRPLERLDGVARVELAGVEPREVRILVDAGLFQGRKDLRLRNWEGPSFDVRALGHVLVTHTHIDHIGYLPRLAKLGLRAPVHLTPAANALAELMLLDAAKIQEEDARYANEAGFSKHRPALPLTHRHGAGIGLHTPRRRGQGNVHRG